MEEMNFPVDLSPQFLQKAAALGVFPADIDEQFVRGSGKGGQKMNKTSSTVVLFHAPTGISVKCQKYREQSINRLSAYKLLILKIEDKIRGAESERSKKIFKLIKQKRKRSKRAKQKMLEAKKHHGEIKEMRQKIQPF
jgi:protein subunit release factor B